MFVGVYYDPDLDMFVCHFHGKRPRLEMGEPEVKAVLSHLEGTPRLVGMLLYGTGMHLMEYLCLRVKDIDFEPNQIVIRDGKGQKDRVTMLPVTVKDRFDLLPRKG